MVESESYGRMMMHYPVGILVGLIGCNFINLYN